MDRVMQLPVVSQARGAKASGTVWASFWMKKNPELCGPFAERCAVDDPKHCDIPSSAQRSQIELKQCSLLINTQLAKKLTVNLLNT